MKISFGLTIIALTLIGYGIANGQTVKLQADKTKSEITYSMKHPLHEWDGTSRDVQSLIVADAANHLPQNAAVRVKLNSFDSKNANRDSHVVEVAEGLTYPEITFSSTSIVAEGGQLRVSGNLKFHGVTNPITFSCKQETDRKGTTISGTFRVKMTDYKIEPPSLLGLATEDEFALTFRMYYPF